jgi:hypothetical protein
VSGAGGAPAATQPNNAGYFKSAGNLGLQAAGPVGIGGGITVSSGGIFSQDGISVNSGGIAVTGGVSVLSNGLFITVCLNFE